MTGVLEAIEASGPAVFLRTSFYLYPILNAVHILALGALVTAVVVMDLRVLGAWRAIPLQSVMALLRPLAVVALILAVVTGGLLFSVRPLDYVANPAFRLKLVLLLVALVNAAAFQVWPRPVLAVLSILIWPAVLLSGRFIGFLQ